MAKKTKILLTAGISVICCLALVVVGTYALFTDSVSVANHLQAGTLKVRLERTNLKWAQLNEDGYLVSGEDSTTQDFTDPTTENIFGIGSDVLVVPGSYYEATLKLSNDGTVALDYKLKIVLTSDSNTLAQQILVVVDGNTASSKSLSTGTNIIGEGFLDKSDKTKSFVVKVQFSDLADNNAAQDMEVSFDLIVEAVQSAV